VVMDGGASAKDRPRSVFIPSQADPGDRLGAVEVGQGGCFDVGQVTQGRSATHRVDPSSPSTSCSGALAHRARLVRQRTAVINELRAVYAKRNIDPQARLQGMHPVVTGANELGGYGPRIVDEDLKLLGFINGQVGGLDTELKDIAHEDGQAKRLMTIPGVGPVSAVAMSCWIGEIQRFSNAKKLASYFGLAPRVRQSADQERHGHITKEGNRMVRMLVIQAALVHTRRGQGPSRKHYLGVLRRRGKQIARVAAANKLLGAIFHMMRERIDYQEFLRRSGAQ
jgi:transposase